MSSLLAYLRRQIGKSCLLSSISRMIVHLFWCATIMLMAKIFAPTNFAVIGGMHT